MNKFIICFLAMLVVCNLALRAHHTHTVQNRINALVKDIQDFQESFDFLDSNGDDLLDVDEFMSAVPGDQAPAFKRVFEINDRDGDGFIDFEEYKRVVQKCPSILSNMTLDLQSKLRPGPE